MECWRVKLCCWWQCLQPPIFYVLLFFIIIFAFTQRSIRISFHTICMPFLILECHLLTFFVFLAIFLFFIIVYAFDNYIFLAYTFLAPSIFFIFWCWLSFWTIPLIFMNLLKHHTKRAISSSSSLLKLELSSPSLDYSIYLFLMSLDVVALNM